MFTGVGPDIAITGPNCRKFLRRRKFNPLRQKLEPVF